MNTQTSDRGLRSKAMALLTKLTVRLLKKPEIQAQLRHIINGQRHPQDAYAKACEIATEQTAEYILQHLLTTFMANGRLRLMALALDTAPKLDGGLYLEFGCGYTGRTIKFIAEHVGGTVHGFDSFEGLPESWFGSLGKGSLHSGQQIPDYPDNVVLHKGWFNDSVPEFVREYPGPVAFMHIDCDLYSSTKDVFDGLGDRIGPGTVIQFDEYFNYPGWQQHEYRAFQEFVSERGLNYDYLGYDLYGYSVAVVMK